MTDWKGIAMGAAVVVALVLYVFLLVAIATGGSGGRDCRAPIEHAYLQEGYHPDAAERMARIECR
jgi:hypothetical protein